MTPQAGPDHVDSHRSPFSPYPPTIDPAQFTVGDSPTPPMSWRRSKIFWGWLACPNSDYFSRSLADVFSETPNLAPYSALLPQVDVHGNEPLAGTCSGTKCRRSSICARQIAVKMRSSIEFSVVHAQAGQPSAAACQQSAASHPPGCSMNDMESN